jgi:hypothetical protein
MNRKFLIVVACALFCAFASGQGPNEGFVMEGEATRHLLEHGDPIDPAIAKATEALQLDPKAPDGMKGNSQ